MTPKIFITGVTGYIAGDALSVIYAEHPDYDYALLVRTKEKAALVSKSYPSARIVLGDLDDSELLEEEAAKADIVLHAADASDHVGAAKAIAAGLIRGHTTGRPGYWLHTGGTGILTYTDSKDDFAGLGTWSTKQYDDLDGGGVEELTSLPDEAFHRNVDKLVLQSWVDNADVAKTVIVCPPTIYGKGRGPVATRGRQVYELARLVLQKGYAPIVGEGKARWNSVHVADLSDVYALLVNKAVSKDTSPDIWGAKGYMFTENGEHVWGDLSRLVASEAARLGYIQSQTSPQDHELGKDEALEVAGFEAVSWGLNSRGKAGRARKVLGWNPSRPSIEDEVPRILEEEKGRIDEAKK